MTTVILLNGPHSGKIISVEGTPVVLWFRVPDGIIEDGKVLASEYRLDSVSYHPTTNKRFATYEWHDDRVRAESLVREVEDVELDD